jgi:hypothetical protein
MKNHLPVSDKGFVYDLVSQRNAAVDVRGIVAFGEPLMMTTSTSFRLSRA